MAVHGLRPAKSSSNNNNNHNNSNDDNSNAEDNDVYDEEVSPLSKYDKPSANNANSTSTLKVICMFIAMMIAGIAAGMIFVHVFLPSSSSSPSASPSSDSTLSRHHQHAAPGNDNDNNNNNNNNVNDGVSEKKNRAKRLGDFTKFKQALIDDIKQDVSKFSKSSTKQSIDCVLSALSSGVPGDFVDVGAGRGGLSMIISKTMQITEAKDRHLWLFDTFDVSPKATGVDLEPEFVAQAAPLSDTIYQLVNLESGLCMSTGTMVACNPPSPRTQWRFNPSTASSVFRSLDAGGNCLDVPASSTKPDAAMGMWKCTEGSPNQMYTYHREGKPGALTWTKEGTLRCLEGKDGKLVSNVCSGSRRQQWRVDSELDLVSVVKQFNDRSLYGPNVFFAKGLFKETIPVAPITEIAVLVLDTDLYESTMLALDYLYPAVSTSGYVVVPGYHSSYAVHAAIDDYLRYIHVNVSLTSGDSEGINVKSARGQKAEGAWFKKTANMLGEFPDDYPI